MMIKYRHFAQVLMVFISFGAYSQETYPERARNYVKQYAAYAIADQKASGVPASITLGQGILETEAGISELMVKANNHFGVKCKNDWKGETFLHTDDAKDECFKKYSSAQESYNDHSGHLHRNPRYHPLFGYPMTDYKKWAHGLKKCGYATNPKYAHELIKIIEEFQLQQYTLAALDTSADTKEEAQAIVAAPAVQEQKVVPPPPIVPPVMQAVAVDSVAMVQKDTTKAFGEMGNIADSMYAVMAKNEQANAVSYPSEEPINDSGKVLTVNGLKAIYCHKNDVLLQYAMKYKIRYSHLLEMNDLPDEPLAYDCYVYLEKKNPTGTKEIHFVKPGETLHMVSQAEGIQLKKLAALNMMTVYEQPQGGIALHLQTPVTEKPPVENSAIRVYNSDVIATNQETLVINTATRQTGDAAKDSTPGQTTAEVGYGMSFAGPNAAAETPQSLVQQKVDTTKKLTPPEVVKQPFMKEDPPQPQLVKPATEAEYKKTDKYYIVKRGETAYSVSKKFGLTVEQFLKMNRIEAEDMKAGQTVIIR